MTSSALPIPSSSPATAITDYTYISSWDKVYDLKLGNDKLDITGLFQGTLASTYVSGNGGNDIISGGTIIDGGSGDDNLITFSTGVNNRIDNPNWPYGSRDYTTARLAGGTGNDAITAGNVSLIAAGGSGSDSLKGSTVNDILWGDGYDALIRTPYGNTYSRGDFADWNSLALNFYGQTFFNTAVSVANSGADLIDGDLGDDWIDGGAGNDTLIGGLGNDTIAGSDGNDSISAGDGADNLSGGFGNDTISAGAGDDVVNAGDGLDLIDAGDGNNSIDAGGDADTITSGAGNDTITAGAGNDSVTSGLGNDSINAGDGDDTVNAGIGADTIAGGLGNDALYGNEDNDSISGNEGDDSLYGGDGADTLYGGAGADRLDAGNGATNALYGEAGNDTLIGGDGADSASGGDNDDSISGAAGDDTLTGDAGNDTLSGGIGNDSLDGGAGSDSLSGGDGNDTLKGGLGADILSGGSGSDTFSYTGENLSDLPDIITDFTAGSGGDVLDLSAVHSFSLTSAGDLWSGSEFAYAHGYIKFTNGLLFQWGSASVGADSSATVTFPVAYTTVATPNVSAVALSGSTTNSQNTGYVSHTLTNLTVELATMGDLKLVERPQSHTEGAPLTSNLP
ncbi:hypothetical protein EBZ80_24465 [bacterium]|nr:hypothetical protein [bacterium]